MLRKKYHIDREFDTLRQLSGEMDEPMASVDRLLCDEKLLELIETDLSKRYPLSTQTGRKSTPVEVILRLLAMRNSSGQQRRKQAYIQLIEVTKASLKQAQKVKTLLEPLNSPLREDW
jgi:hypothetical protein